MKTLMYNIEKYLFLFIYGLTIYVYIYNSIDKGLSVTNGKMNLIMLIVGIVILITNSKKIMIYKETGIAFCLMVMFLIWCIISEFFSRYENLIFDHLLNYIIFVIDIFVIGLCIAKFRVIIESMFIPFCVIAYMLIERLLVYSKYISFDSLDILNSFFRKGNYVRVPFGFANVNVLGNICLFEICLFVILISYFIEKKEIKYAFVLKILLSIIAICDIYIMLYTSTRTAIICSLILVCLLFITYFFKSNNLKGRIFFAIIAFFFITLLVIYLILLGKFSISAFDSITGRNNSLNLKTIKTVKDLILGIGFVNPGLFGMNALGEVTTWMDNYYIYIYITTGMVGAILNFGFIYLIGRQLLLRVSEKNSRYELYIFYMFIILCISGLLETSVLYPQFIFSFVGFSIFWASINENSQYHF